ncbi:MAG: hypothetical protein ACQEQC_08420 [Elusimicrobiota bacterium]
MKKVILAFLMIFTALPVLGHSPDSITLNFDREKSTVAIKVGHSVRDEESHYVKQVQLWLNEEEILTQKFSSQADSTSQKALYYLPSIKEGDQIEVSVDCNKFGKYSKKFEVKFPEEKQKESKEEEKKEKENKDNEQ